VANGKTLIAYFTKGGVTAEYASEIANVLREKHSLEVEVINLRENSPPDLSQYRNIVVGSGVRIQRVYKEALKFIEKNDFKDKKVAIFLSSAEAGNPKSHNDAIRKYIKGQVLAKNPRIEPVAAEAFGGRMKILGRVISDNRDISKVKAWADELGKKLTD
jgi:menaquinone-dependent protoporphyrinogen IX oxidase